MSKVLVTGANGFVALHIVGTLLDKGYAVVGTVRSKEKAEKLSRQFQAKYGSPKLEFEIIPDIGVEGAFDELFKRRTDIEYVLHTASPFSFGSDGDLKTTFLDPAVNGTINVLKSVHIHAPQVKKVVITSSFAAVTHFDKVEDPTFIHTEKTWNPIEWDHVNGVELVAYIASKKLAERAAWDYVSENKTKFKLSTVTPPYIFGPQYFDEDAKAETLNTTSQILKSLLSTDANDTHYFNDPKLLVVDVRDVAKFHVLALEKPASDNHRLFPTVGGFSAQLFLNIINNKYPEFHGKIAKGDPVETETEIYPAYDNSESEKVLGGYNYISTEQIVTDSVDQLLEAQK